MVRVLEVLSSLVYLLVFLTLGVRAQNLGGLDVPRLGVVPPLVIVPALTILALTLVGVTWLRVRQRSPGGLYTALLVLPLVIGVSVGGWTARAVMLRRIQADDGDTRFYFTRPMTEVEAHAFSLRLLATALSDRTRGGNVQVTTAADLQVPTNWPLPEGFGFALVPGDDQALALWSHRNGDTCRILLTPDWRTAGPDLGFTCAPPGPFPDSWEPADRRPAVAPLIPAPVDSPFSPWPQYRLDPVRTATVRDSAVDSTAPFWYATIGGPSRATPSVSGPLVLIGTHGTGMLEAHDRETGHLVWRAREPNWIHQDAVTDGHLVFVGFGDNDKSFKGAAPSGVAAHDLRTGRRIWTRFLDNSTMTSPVVLDSLVVFGTAKGGLIGADKRTGETRWERHLPGNLVMGPPLLSGDTVIVPLDPRGMCSLNGTDGTVHWCTQLPPHAGSVGHISPALLGGDVFGSLNTFPPSVPGMLQDFRLEALPLLWTWAITGENPIPTHQKVFALSLSSGSLRWESDLDGGDCCGSPGQRGHMSGTPVVVPHDSSLVVVSPFSDRVYRLDEKTGEVLARSAPIPTFPRGPALVVDTTVIAVDRQGLIHVLSVGDLQERCAIPTGELADRAGPTVAGEALLHADRDGGLYSIPLRDVLRCDPTLSDRIGRLREASVPGG